ncbi:MAG: efflux RND transporter permease subunit [candidate division KSB1 bacterium]|nr:efflux RND transporter permease subunit [candidate division KSB1 bacterium]
MKKPITMLMLILSVIVLGVLGLKRLPLTFYPEFSAPSLTINVPYPSSSPQEVERLIARPIEDIMGTLSPSGAHQLHLFGQRLQRAHRVHHGH